MTNDEEARPSPQFQLPIRTEVELRRAVLQRLRAQGMQVRERVACSVGEADIVTALRDVVYECKLRLDRKALLQATGQVLLYRQAINPDARAVIIGYATADTAALVSPLAELGVEIVAWQDDVPEAVPAPVSAPALVRVPRSPSPTLHWNVAACAQARGITKVTELAFQVRIKRQSLYQIWRDEAQFVSLNILSRLAHGLGAAPGEWFAWEGEGDAYRLRWRVAEAAQAAGMDAAALLWQSEVFPASLHPILEGSAQAVHLATLAKLARALGLEVGELFVWREG